MRGVLVFFNISFIFMALVQFCDYRGKTKADMKSHSRVHFREVEKQIGKRRGISLGNRRNL